MSSSEAEVPDRPDDDLTIRHESDVPTIATTDRSTAMSDAVDTTLLAVGPEGTGEPTPALDTAETIAPALNSVAPDAKLAAEPISAADTAIAPPPAAPKFMPGRVIE